MATDTENGTVTLRRVNTPPAQTWNYLRANDITLTVPKLSRKGDVYFALPQLFRKVECGMGEQVTAWVTSQAADATYVEVGRGERRSEPIVVDIDSDAGDVQDTGVMVREGAEATVVVVAHGTSKEARTSSALVRVIAEKRTLVHLYEFVAAGEATQHLESVGIDADDDARIDVHQFLLGSKTCALGLTANLTGDGARIDLVTRYYGRGHERIDINHVVRNRGENTRSEVHENGILEDAADKSLRATIDLVHGGKGAKGNEAETVLVLGDDVTNKTMPVILCDEDDVQGNHGATIGSVAPEEVQYLRDRGLSEDEVERLYVRALFDHAVISAPDALARKAVLTRAAEVLGSDVAGDLAEGLGLDEEEEA